MIMGDPAVIELPSQRTPRTHKGILLSAQTCGGGVAQADELAKALSAVEWTEERF